MDVDPIDFNRVDRHHRPGHGLPADFVVEPVTLQLGAGLGVGETVDAAVGIQDDGAGHHRPGQAAAADFVHAGHRHEAVAVERIFYVPACGNLRHLYALYARYAPTPKIFSLPSSWRPCPSDRAGNTAWRGALSRTARLRPLKWSANAAGRCAPRPG